eukprot:714731_1
MVGTELGFTALRAFRIFKLFRYSRKMRELLAVVLDSLEDLMYFMLILFLFMFIYALLGYQLFRGKIDERANFDTFWWSLVTVFQVVTGENWNDVLISGVEATGWWSTLYFGSMFVVGNYMVLSLFLAILLGNFEDDDDANDAKKPSAAKEMSKSRKHVREFGAKLKRMLSKKFHTDGAVSPMPSPRPNEEENKPMLVDRPLTHGNISVMRVEKDIDVEVLEKDKIDHTGIQRVALQHRSFFILGAENKFRVAVV